MDSLQLLGAVRRTSSRRRAHFRGPAQHGPRRLITLRRVVGAMLFAGSLLSSYFCARSGSTAAMAAAAGVFLVVVIGIFAISARRRSDREPAGSELVEGDEVIRFETVPPP